MHFPWWYVPGLTSPMLIALIAVVQVLVSHYAVGGGFFLAVEVGHARKTGNLEYLDYLRRHGKFFILITVVFGAITGVGIWWTIGLASPLATSKLINIFVFGWAMEWVFFLIEIVSAFVFYYFWTRLPARTHVIMGWIYALAAWISLVLIAGITAFMLNPGEWTETGNFWHALLNPQFLPQTIIRTGGCFLLATLYVMLHASFTLKNTKLRDLIERRAIPPSLLGALMIVVGAAWWWLALPESAMAAIMSAAVLNVFFAMLFGLSFIIVMLLLVTSFRFPGWLTPGYAITLFILGLTAFSLGEFMREACRKPYIVYNVVMSNQILPSEIAELQEHGYLEGGTWTKAHIVQNYPAVLVDGKIDGDKLLALSDEDRVQVGGVLFQYHCNDCHATRAGYAAVGPLLTGRNRDEVHSIVTNLNRVRFVMPPWCGTDAEAELLTDYLMTIAPPQLEGMILSHTDVPPKMPELSSSAKLVKEVL